MYYGVCGHTVAIFFRVNQRMPSLPDMLQTVLLFHHRIKMPWDRWESPVPPQKSLPSAKADSKLFI